ncbi:hypothetical protein Tco_0877750 [Tanacetum coccineum]|uniref:Reverse transcriptase domain-containing protein n=1 Tax=Tanacetum coccineum TaxID=301880 RepID=A0ABQ5C1Q9_9ASTR
MSLDEASSRLLTHPIIIVTQRKPSDVGLPRVIVYGYDGLPMHLVNPDEEAALLALPFPDYVSGSEEPEQGPPSPDYVPGIEYLEYLAPSDDEILVKDQPHAADASPIALSTGYIADSDPEEDPDDESEDGPTDYPADRGDDDYSSGDDTDVEDVEEASKEDKEEEEEHLASADSTAVSSSIDHVPSAEETKPFKTNESAATPPPPPAYRTTARMSVRSQAPIPFPPEAELARLLAIPTTPPSPLTPLSSSLPQIPSPPLHDSGGVAHITITSTTYHHLLLYIPSTDRRADIPEVVLPPRKRLCIAPGPRFEVGESSSAAATRPTRGHRADYGFIGTLDAELRRDRVREMGYGITNVWEDLTEATEEVPPTSVAELSQRVTDLVTTIRQDTNEIYVRFEDAQDDQGLLRGQVNMLYKERQYHLNTSMLVESISDSYSDSRHPHLFTGGTGYDIASHTTSLQTQLIAALGRIDTLEARDPAHTNDPEDADSCISTALLQQKYTWWDAGTNSDSNVVTELGSFDVIIGMDWLAKYHVVIVCDEKLVRIPFRNETLIIRGDGSNRGNETQLNIILCTKTQKYMLKGCHVFLAHVTTKKTEDKSEEKRLEDVPIVQDFPEVFPDTSTLLISFVQDERVIGATARTIRQRFYKTQFLTLGSSGLVCQEEGWIILNVHRLPRTEQANGEESLSTLED